MTKLNDLKENRQQTLKWLSTVVRGLRAIMHINPSIYSGKPFQCLLVVLLQVIEVCHCKFDMVKTKQTKRKSEAEKERWEKYRIAKVPSRFGTVAKVATHGPPVLPGRPGSARNLPDYHGKYFILNIHSI